MKVLAILGASGHGKVVADIAENLGWQNIVFFDDAWPSLSVIGKWRVLGNFESLVVSDIDSVFVAIGDANVRINKLSLLKSKNKNLETIIHPSAEISRYSSVGEGSIVCEGAVIKAFSKVGCATIINSNATIGHDCLISDACHISLGSSVAGNVTIGSRSWVGNGASVRQNIKIGSNVMIGTGAVVVNHIDSDLVVVGNPARPIVK
ncbi:acetyltransferase [Vibrio crassostreae]|uniref:acetyltransferase n=1 Tax=Vibrio crassostreae TaxID=246167 RepID=UPI001B302642|nr:acetyltransferase [Vibrio crassostreae]